MSLGTSCHLFFILSLKLGVCSIQRLQLLHIESRSVSARPKIILTPNFYCTES